MSWKLFVKRWSLTSPMTDWVVEKCDLFSGRVLTRHAENLTKNDARDMADQLNDDDTETRFWWSARRERA